MQKALWYQECRFKLAKKKERKILKRKKNKWAAEDEDEQ